MSGVVSKQAWIIGSLWLSASALAAGPPSARGVAAVASDQPLASACGTDVLARGGNAVDHRADLHALGLLLYELTAGDNPYFDEDARVAMRRILAERQRG